MNITPILILLTLNAVLIIVMLIVLIAVVRQGRRITRLADDTGDRMRQVHGDEGTPPSDEESNDPSAPSKMSEAADADREHG